MSHMLEHSYTSCDMHLSPTNGVEQFHCFLCTCQQHGSIITVSEGDGAYIACMVVAS